MELGEYITKYRKEAGITIEDLATKSGVPKGTINKIIAGTTKSPTLENVRAIAMALGKSINDFVEQPENAKKAPSITDEAMKFAERYEKLDSIGRGSVNAIMKYEENRMAEGQQTIGKYNMEAATMLDMIVYSDPSAAGVPLYAENDYEHIEFPVSEVPRGADFGVRISGDSMEPTIHDDTIVWVHKVPELQEGQIGIFMVDDGAVCKRFHNTGNGIELQSDNPKYEPIKVSEFERLGIVGRVLGYK